MGKTIYLQTDPALKGTPSEDSWTQAVLDAAGAIPDFPDLDEIRQVNVVDVTRIALVF